MRDYFSASLAILSVGNVVSEPPVEALKDCLVLLDHEQPRTLLRRNAQISGYSVAKVTVLGPVSRIVGPYRDVAIDFADPDYPYVVGDGFSLVAEEAFVETYLCL